MKRRDNSSRSVDDEAADVLARRRPSSLRRLLELIREINPTRQTLAPSVEATRYRVKSALQSLLIRDYAEELRVEPPTAPGGAWGLRHKYSGGDGCHVALDELDPDARSWVQLQIDTGHAGPLPATPSARSPGGARPSSQPVADHLTAGRAALAEYDYETARQELSLAVETSGGATEPSLLLLELLVDTLAADADALTIEASLAAETHRQPPIRILLAIAAARTEDQARAMSALPDIDHPRIPEVLTILVRTALRQDRLEDALALARDLSERAPGHPETRAVQEEIDQRRRALAAPMERELTAAADRSDPELEARARTALTQHPESAIARRIVREIDERRRHDTAETLEREALQALHGHPDHAVRLLKKARDLAPDPHLDVLLADAEALARQTGEEARVSEVRLEVEAGHLQTGLPGYAALPPARRDRIREQLRLDELEWLELLLRAHHKDPQADVDAVLALRRAARLSAAGRHADVVEELRPHSKDLGRVPRAAELLADAQRNIDSRNRAHAERALAEAHEHAGRADWAGTRRALDLCDDALLPDSMRSERAALDDTCRYHERLAATLARVETLAASDLIGARDLARATIAETRGDGRARWTERAAALASTVRRTWNCHSTNVAGPGLEYPELVPTIPTLDNVGYQLTGNGGALALASALGRHVFIWLIDVIEGRVRRTLSLTVPSDLDADHFLLEDTTLWTVGDDGALLQVDLPSGEPLYWSDGQDCAPPSCVAERHLRIPGSRCSWVSYRPFGSRARELTCIIDLDRRRVVRELHVGGLMSLVPGPRPAVLLSNLYGGASVAEASGSPRTAIAALAEFQVDQLLPHPGDDAWLATVSASPEEGDNGESETDGDLRLVLLPRSLRGPADPANGTSAGDNPPPLTGADVDADPDGPHSLVVCRETGMAFCLHGGYVNCLVAYRCEDGQLTRHFTMDAGEGCALLADVGARSAAILRPTPTGIVLSTLDRAAPPFSMDPPSPDGFLRIPSASSTWCDGDAGRTTSDELLKALRMLRGRSRLEWLRRAWATHKDQSALFRPPVRFTDLAREELAWGCWPEAREVLEAARAATTVGWLPHDDHLLGITRALTGDREGAVAALTDAREKGTCKVDEWLPLCDRSLVPSLDPLDTYVRQLLGAVAAADTLVAAGNAPGAISVLTRRAVFDSREVQSLARLAAAHLGVAPGDPLAAFRRRIALAAFVHAHDQAIFRREVPLFEAHWGRARLDALSGRCQAELMAERGS